MSVKPIIAVFFDAPNIDGYPFDDAMFLKAYRELNECIVSRGARFVVVRGQESYLGGSRFSHCWDFMENGFERSDEPIDVNVIFDKGNFRGDAHARLLNDPALERLCTDKFAAYEMFPQFCPTTLLVHNTEECAEALRKMRTALAVYKPQFGEGGEGVIIATPEEIRAQELHFPGIVQEFIDTSGGIPGIIDSRHDMRLIHMNDELVFSSLRTPPAGSYLANVARGGKYIEVPLEKLPPEVLKVEREIDAALAHFGRRTYSIDFGRDVSGRWYVIEMNAKPGLDAKEEGERCAYTQERLTDLLMEAAAS